MFIAVWVQDSTWYLLVSQNGVNYISSGMGGPQNVKGIRDLYLLASTTNGIQFYIRDLFVSNGREYDKDNILVNSNQFFNNACDDFSGVDIQFGSSEQTADYSWPADVVYTFSGSQDPTNDFDTSLTVVSGCKLPITVNQNHTIQFEVNMESPAAGIEYLIYLGSYVYQVYNYQGNLNDLYIPGVSSTWSGNYDSFVLFKIVSDSDGIKLYVDGELKASHPLSSLNFTTLSDGFLMGTANGVNPFYGKMKNLKLYNN